MPDGGRPLLRRCLRIAGARPSDGSPGDITRARVYFERVRRSDQRHSRDARPDHRTGRPLSQRWRRGRRTRPGSHVHGRWWRGSTPPTPSSPAQPLNRPSLAVDGIACCRAASSHRASAGRVTAVIGGHRPRFSGVKHRVGIMETSSHGARIPDSASTLVRTRSDGFMSGTSRAMPCSRGRGGRQPVLLDRQPRLGRLTVHERSETERHDVDRQRDSALLLAVTVTLVATTTTVPTAASTRSRPSVVQDRCGRSNSADRGGSRSRFGGGDLLASRSAGPR